MHLHVHTDASVLDGFCKPEDYAKQAASFGMKALAITDHGSLSNSHRFSKACKSYGIKPIIGCEFYTSEHIGERDAGGKRLDAKKHHIIVIAKNRTGWANLVRLNKLSFSDTNYYYKPTVSIDDILRFSDGLIVTTACKGSLINSLLIDGKVDEAYSLAMRLKDVFGEDFYLEAQINELEDNKRLVRMLPEFARRVGAKIVLTNDVHYTHKHDHRIQDIVIAIAQKTTLNDKKRFSLDVKHLYFAGRDDFVHFDTMFGYGIGEGTIDEWLQNTLEVADKCELDGVPKFDTPPVYRISQETASRFGIDAGDPNAKRILAAKILSQGMKTRVESGHIDQSRLGEYRARSKHEMETICRMGYLDYFLIVWDIVMFAKSRGIAVGPGRGSVGGSLVAYLMGITNIDPIRWGTVFERFLSVDRYDPPDIDLDFDKDRREEIFEYLNTKYHTIQVGTAQNFGVKNSLRDCARVMSLPKNKLAVIDKICKSLSYSAEPDDLKRMLDADKSLIEAVPELKEMYNVTKRIYGSSRSIGCHASGVCVIDKDVEPLIPVNRSDNVIVTAYSEGDERELSELGLMKIDILGLKTISVLKRAFEHAKKTRGDGAVSEAEAALERLDWIDEPWVVGEFKRDNTGIFQFDSNSLYNFMLSVDPVNFGHIIDSIALFRPDVLLSGQAKAYIDRKSGKEIPPKYMRENAAIREICGKTYYTFVYQEQIMWMLVRLFGFSMAEANRIRKFIAKKKRDELVKTINEKFGQSSESQSVDRQKVGELNELIDMLLCYGGYSFNFSHAVAYSVLAAQCAWVRRKYPAEFYAALAEYNSDDPEKMVRIMNSAKSRGIMFLPVDINESEWLFKVESDRRIRCGLSLLKGFPYKAGEEILRVRRSNGGAFGSVSDFFSSDIDWGVVNKRSVELLIKCGAFNQLCHNMRSVWNAYECSVVSNKKARKKRGGSFGETLWDMMCESGIVSDDTEDFSAQEKMKFEIECFGYSWWVNIFADYGQYVSRLSAKNLLTDLGHKNANQFVFAYVVGVKKVISKRGQTYYFADLLDHTGAREEVMIPAGKLDECVSGTHRLFSFSSYHGRDGQKRFSIKSVVIPSVKS